MSRRELNLLAVSAVLFNLYFALNGKVLPELNWITIGWVGGVWWAFWQIRRTENPKPKRTKWRDVGKAMITIFVATLPLLTPLMLASQNGWTRDAWIGGLLWGLLCIPGALLIINWLYRGDQPPKADNSHETVRQRLVDSRFTDSGYSLVRDVTHSRWGIRCNDCNTISWSLDDVKKRYCSHCQKWHKAVTWPAKDHIIEGRYHA